ncbi:MAG TPA: hypothetical protein ENL06_01105 [Candidatus Portnoybacteria bacterium]|nr:hypothetical protein [Candidatus Portnoybacteria bacterium]
MRVADFEWDGEEYQISTDALLVGGMMSSFTEGEVITPSIKPVKRVKEKLVRRHIRLRKKGFRRC